MDASCYLFEGERNKNQRIPYELPQKWNKIHEGKKGFLLSRKCETRKGTALTESGKGRGALSVRPLHHEWRMLQPSPLRWRREESEAEEGHQAPLHLRSGGGVVSHLPLQVPKLSCWLC